MTQTLLNLRHLTTIEEIRAYQKELKRWQETKAGAAFVKYQRLIGSAWVTDSRENVSERRLKEVWEAAKKAQEELIQVIKELQSLEGKRREPYRDSDGTWIGAAP